MIPSNLRVIKYLSGSVEIAWDGVLSDNESYAIYGLNYESALWEEIGQARTGMAVVFGPYSAIKIAVLSGAILGTFSDILAIAISNASNINTAVVVGKDESGQSRFLATTPEGVLKVTGATITNYGGDASAANQTTQISQLNNLATSLGTTITALNNILNKLNAVGLDAANITALKAVNITNLPNDFPDFALLSAINNFASVAAKAQNILDLITAVNANLKTADLNIDGAKDLGVKINNLPSDYPDSAAGTKLSDIIFALSTVNGNLDNANLTLADVLTAEGMSQSVLVSIESIITGHTARLDSIITDIGLILAECQSVKTSTDAISSNTAATSANTVGLLKTANLNIDGNKNLGVIINNIPNDYPDSAALATLTQISNNVMLLNQGIDANITNALPTGNNIIGRVDISTLPLPENAALETTQQDVKALLNSQLAMQAFTKDGIDYLNAKLSTIEARLENNLKLRTKIFDEVIELSSVSSIRLLDYYDDVQPEELNNFDAYEIIILSYASAFDAVIRYESAYHGQSFYHSVKTCNLNLASINVSQLSMPLQNISIRFAKALPGQTNNADVARVIIFARN